MGLAAAIRALDQFAGRPTRRDQIIEHLAFEGPPEMVPFPHPADSQPRAAACRAADTCSRARLTRSRSLLFNGFPR